LNTDDIQLIIIAFVAKEKHQTKNSYLKPKDSLKPRIAVRSTSMLFNSINRKSKRNTVHSTQNNLKHIITTVQKYEK